MSLVGPRPHALSHDREYERRISLYARRHNVKPGITGWAQIHGYRGETDTDEKMRKRVEYDLFYIDNWSLWLDLKIIVAHGVVAGGVSQRVLIAYPGRGAARSAALHPGHARCLLQKEALARQRGDGGNGTHGDDRGRNPQHADQEP